jgi:hypothetical protein
MIHENNNNLLCLKSNTAKKAGLAMPGIQENLADNYSARL